MALAKKGSKVRAAVGEVEEEIKVAAAVDTEAEYDEYEEEEEEVEVVSKPKKTKKAKPAPIVEADDDDEEEEEVVRKPKKNKSAPEADEEAGTAVVTNNVVNQEVAVHTDNKVAQSMTNTVAELAMEGFEGLELDFSSFTGIVLDKSEFVCSNGDVMENGEFYIRITQVRAKYAFKSDHPKDADKEVVYSYDKNAHTDPESNVFERIQEWKEDGQKLEGVKKYLEVWAMMEDDGEDGSMDGTLVSLSIPPTSQGKISGHILTQKQLNGDGPSDYITKVSRGKKVTGVDFPFYPWDFKRYNPEADEE